MKVDFSPKNNPRVIIIQKLYGNLFNEDGQLDIPKHRFKKFIKDIIVGTIERNEIIAEELEKNLEVLLFSGLNFKKLLMMKLTNKKIRKS